MTPARKTIAIAAKIAAPWRREPTIRPYVAVSETGITRMRNSSTKFEIAFGFSNGIAELTLKKPPPFVPSSLMTSWEATGPSASWPPPPAMPWTVT